MQIFICCRNHTRASRLMHSMCSRFHLMHSILSKISSISSTCYPFYLFCVILQLFVANQNKPTDIVNILCANKTKLLRFFDDFNVNKGSEIVFIDIIIEHIVQFWVFMFFGLWYRGWDVWGRQGSGHERNFGTCTNDAIELLWRTFQNTSSISKKAVYCDQICFFLIHDNEIVNCLVLFNFFE